MRNTISDCSKANWIMRQIWEMNLMKKWKRQKNANVSKNSHYCINQKNYLINFVFAFAFVLKRMLDALFSNDRNRQATHERFRLIFILNRRNDVNFILRLDLFSFWLLYNFDRNVNYFFEKLILNSDTLYFENIEQFLILDLSEIKSSFRCLCSLLELN